MTDDEVREYAATIVGQIKTVGEGIAEWLKPPVTFQELGRVAAAIVELVEQAVPGPKLGPDRKRVAKAVFDELDRIYAIRRWIDDAIRLPRFLEWADDMVIPLILEFLIDTAVGVLNHAGRLPKPA